MLSVAMLSLLVPTVGAMNVTSSSALLQQGDPPVEIWVNKTDARLGDRVKVHARTDMDGYLLILHAEPDGRIRVLFPIDPVYDNFVRGGDRFEVIGRGDREAFRVYSASGTGTVYAAYSRDPFRFEEFTRNNHWDYGQPDTWWVLDDAEADLTNLAAQMAGGAYFDYDFLEYSVWDATVASSGSATQITYYGSTPYYSPWSFGIGFYWGMGPSYYPYSYYWDRWYWRTRYYNSWYPYSWYNDWYYGWYNPYRYHYYYGYYPPRYYGGYTTPVVYGDTHLRYRPRLTASNSDTRARRAYVPTTSAGRVAAASSASATTRGVTGSGRRTMPQVSSRTATTERATTSTQRGVSSARRVTGVSSQPAQSSSSSRTATARRTTSRTQVAPSRTQTSGSQASPTRTPTSRSTATVRRTPTAGSQPSQPTRPTARAVPAPRTSVRQPVQRSQPSVSNRSAPAPSRSTPVRATPSAPARTPAARPAPAPRVSRPSAPSASRPSAPSASRPSAPSRPSSSSSKPSSSSSSSSRPRKP